VQAKDAVLAARETDTKVGPTLSGYRKYLLVLYGNASQLLLQFYGAAFIIVYNAIATYIILKVIGFIVPLRMDEATLKVGDDAVHGETAYAIGTEGE